MRMNKYIPDKTPFEEGLKRNDKRLLKLTIIQLPKNSTMIQNNNKIRMKMTFYHQTYQVILNL